MRRSLRDDCCRLGGRQRLGVRRLLALRKTHRRCDERVGAVTPRDLGWWVVSGGNLLSMLRRAHDGEDPDLIYAEEYANSDHERPSDD